MIFGSCFSVTFAVLSLCMAAFGDLPNQSDPDQFEIDEETEGKISQEVLQLINHYREFNNLSSLNIDPKMSHIAKFLAGGIVYYKLKNSTNKIFSTFSHLPYSKKTSNNEYLENPQIDSQTLISFAKSAVNDWYETLSTDDANDSSPHQRMLNNATSSLGVGYAMDKSGQHHVVVGFYGWPELIRPSPVTFSHSEETVKQKEAKEDRCGKQGLRKRLLSFLLSSSNSSLPHCANKANGPGVSGKTVITSMLLQSFLFNFLSNLFQNHCS